MTIQTFTTILGWCTFINIILLCFSTVLLMLFRERAKAIHHKLFAIDVATLDEIYFRYLANYKLLIIVFNLVPYIVLAYIVK